MSNHHIKHALDGSRIAPSNHSGCGVPWCSHMVCPAFTAGREGDPEGSHLGADDPGTPDRCAHLPGPPSDVCVPAVRVMAKMLGIGDGT